MDHATSTQEKAEMTTEISDEADCQSTEYEQGKKR